MRYVMRYFRNQKHQNFGNGKVTSVKSHNLGVTGRLNCVETTRRNA